jgi:quercetin dioxygenase-like cupin family protein
MSAIHRFTGNQQEDIYSWEGVDPIIINTDTVHGVIKNVLVGQDDGAPTFIIRYFQVPSGESTFHHEHPHEHGIVLLHGKAEVMINGETHTLNPLSAIFISGGDIHKITNIGETPLGFLCIIPIGAEV